MGIIPLTKVLPYEGEDVPSVDQLGVVVRLRDTHSPSPAFVDDSGSAYHETVTRGANEYI